MRSAEASGAMIAWSIDPQNILKDAIGMCPKLESIGRPGQEEPFITFHRTDGKISSCTVMSIATIPRSFDLGRLRVTPMVEDLSIEGNPLTTTTRYLFRIPGRPDWSWSRQVWEAWADHLRPFDGEVDTVFVTQYGCPPISDLIDLLGRRRPNATGRIRLDMGKQALARLDLTDLFRAADGKIREIYFSDSKETVWPPWTDTLRAISNANLREITYLRIPVTPEIGSMRERLSSDGLTWTDIPSFTSIETLHLHFVNNQQEHVNIPLLAESLLAVAGPLCEYLITRNGQGDWQERVREEIDRIIRMKREAQERGWRRLRGVDRVTR